jgi:hypothetical protein
MKKNCRRRGARINQSGAVHKFCWMTRCAYGLLLQWSLLHFNPSFTHVSWAVKKPSPIIMEITEAHASFKIKHKFNK